MQRPEARRKGEFSYEIAAMGSRCVGGVYVCASMYTHVCACAKEGERDEGGRQS